PEAALLVAAERGACVKTIVCIDPDRARFDFGCHAVRELDVLGPNRRYQAVDGAVGDGNGLIRILEADRRKHRSENLFLRDLHVRLDLRENGRLHEETFAIVARRVALTAALELGALFDAGTD